MNHDKSSVTARIASFHRSVADTPGHAIEVWEDGEITSTKCSGGVLYGIRTLHCLTPGFDSSIPQDCFPEHNAHHSFVRVATMEDAYIIREIIKSNL